jgi:hypothetical protein
MDNYFIWTKHGEKQPETESIIDERAKENMGIPDDMCSHHDDGCEDDIGQDDVDHCDEGFDMDELMHNVAPDVLLQIRNKGFDKLRCLIKHQETFFTKSVKGVIRSTWCCG